ncbi:MAG: NAD(P)/FAD-dependent oxidoreductase, partial [Limisphaerales bacterium]
MATHQHQTERAGDRVSLWEATIETPALQPLRENTRADVCVVGAGISGLSVAYGLISEGKSVVVLDDGLVGRGMTGRTTAHIVNALDDRYYELEKLHGEEGARLAAESHTAAIAFIEKIVREEKIECEFERVDGYLFEPPNESAKNLRMEFEACQRAGIDVEWVERAPLTGFHTGPAIRFLHQAQFHPLRYLRGLAEAIEREGGRIFTGTRVSEVQGGDEARATTHDGRTVLAGAMVVATNSPINDRYVIHTKQSPYMTYVIGLRLPKGSVTRALYWDTAEHAGQEDKILGMVPYHYARLANGPENDEILVVGGEDHKTGQADDFEQRYERLEEWARALFPSA